MKKNKLLGLIGLSVAVLMIGACGQKSGDNGGNQSNSSHVITQTYTVAFEVDGARYKTLKVKAGETITDEVADPTKEGFNFVGWYEGETLVDLATYVVNYNVTFTAKFEEANIDTSLNVNDVKEEGKEYYLVLGWWETTSLNDDGTPKITSGMTETTTRLFYANLIKYLKAVGATDDNITAISFRNYSSDTVANMGAAVTADGDVDILVGVGNNVNSTAGLTLYNSSNDYKFSTTMGSQNLSRYVACLSTASELGVATYEWLRDTDAGKKAFVAELTDAEIEASLAPEEINLSVTVHGDTDITTLLNDKDDVVEMPTITVAEGKLFKGFALTADGEVALDVTKDAVLKYADLKDLVAEGAHTLDLYPVIQDAPVVESDLVVYVQVNGSNLTMAEAKLFEARFKETLTDEDVKFNILDQAADAFKQSVKDGGDADIIIGGNNPVKVDNFTLYDATNYPVINAAAKHFRSTNRKVLIPDTIKTDHVALATSLYSFLSTEAPEFEVHAAFWTKGGDWVTTDERSTIASGIQTNLENYLGIKTADSETLESIYNVKLTLVDVVTEGNKVADLGAATLALREGKGTDLVIGCGGNIESTGGVSVVEMKDIPTTIVLNNRKVALIRDNVLTRNVYDSYFAAA